MSPGSAVRTDAVGIPFSLSNAGVSAKRELSTGFTEVVGIAFGGLRELPNLYEPFHGSSEVPGGVFAGQALLTKSVSIVPPELHVGAATVARRWE